MSFLSSILGKILEYIYKFVSSVGTEPESISYFAITIIVMTVIYKLAMLPITLSNIKMQKATAKLQPEMKKLEKKYKHDPQLYQKKVMELQKDMGVNPLSSCLPLIVQMIIIMALLAVMRDPIKYMGVSKDIATNFFWIPDLAKPDPTKLVLPLLLSGTQILMSLSMQQKKEDGAPDQMKSMNFMMTWAMPIMFFFMFKNYDAGLALYWTVGNVIELIIRIIIKQTTKEDKVVEKVSDKKGNK